MTQLATPLHHDRSTTVTPGGLFVILHGLVLIFALAWWIYDPQAQFLAIGAAAALIVSVPMALRTYNYLSPWTLLALIIIVGAEIRGAAIAVDLRSHYLIDSLFLLGHEPTYFLRPSLYYLLGLVILTLAYSVKSSPRGGEPRRSNLVKRIEQYEFNRYVGLFCGFLALISAIAFVLYAQRTGGFSLASLSAKRTTIGDLTLDQSYESHGVLRYVHGLGKIAFWVYLAHLTASNKTRSLISGNGLFLLLLFLNAASLPFYASSRSGIGYILLVGLAIEVALNKRGVNRRALAAGGAVLLVVLSIMSIARASQPGESSPLGPGTQLVNGVENTIVFNRNFGDVTTTSHVINSVPDILHYKYGETIGSWLVAPIPRSIWPNKPLVSLGPTIGVKVYGNARSGVPPGFIGEMYWDWGIFGIIGGCVVFGRFLRRANDRWIPGKGSPALALCYCVALLPVGYHIWSTGVGQGLFGLAKDFGMLFVALLLCGSIPKKNRT